MASDEKYYYVFKYIDGSTQEFEQYDDGLFTILSNNEMKKIVINNVIINLDHVIKITIESHIERVEAKRLSDEKAKENAELIRNMRL